MSVKLAAVKGRMRNNDYWVGSVTFPAIEKNVKLPEDDHWDDIFGEGQEEAQRRLNKPRVTGNMVPYLDHEDAFFSSLTMILVPMDGQPLEENRDYRFIHEPDSKVGVLEIEDHVHMFPADGQHRSATIIEAIRQNKSKFMKEEVAVVLLPFKEKDQVRQLFADLNLHAKAASGSIGKSFETRDPLIVATKRVMRDVALFQGRVNEQTNSLAKKSPDVVTMNTLAQAHETLLKALYPVRKGRDYRDHEELQAIRQLDPSEARVTDVSDKLRDVWDVVIGAIPQWQDVVSGDVSARELRDGDEEQGTPGYIFAYGIGWQAIGLVAAAMIKYREEDWSEELAKAIELVDWQKGPQWNGIAMIGDRVNNTGPGVRATAGYILKVAGFKPEDGEDIESLLNALDKSLAGFQEAKIAAEAVAAAKGELIAA
jgi:DGQHR domain-containing protein